MFASRGKELPRGSEKPLEKSSLHKAACTNTVDMATPPAAVIYKISIADAAQTDLDDILEWTTRAFAATGRKRYEALIQTALTDLPADPKRIGVRLRDDIGAGICTYHLSTSRKHTRTAVQVGKPRHLVFFRVKGNAIQILRFLHGSMDFARHVSDLE